MISICVYAAVDQSDKTGRQLRFNIAFYYLSFWVHVTACHVGNNIKNCNNINNFRQKN